MERRAVLWHYAILRWLLSRACCSNLRLLPLPILDELRLSRLKGIYFSRVAYGARM